VLYFVLINFVYEDKGLGVHN